MAYREFEYEKAKEKLNLLAKELEMRYPKAADRLREGLEQTLSVHRLRVPGLLRETLSNTNAMESANSVCAGILLLRDQLQAQWNDTQVRRSGIYAGRTQLSPRERL